MAIPKDAGGLRFVGLATGVLRVIMRGLRQDYVVEWMATNVPSEWFGVTGRSTEQAVWRQGMFAHTARIRGWDAYEGLYDVEKAFDHVDPQLMLDEFDSMGFPTFLSRALLVFYAADGLLVISGVVVGRVSPTTSIVPGCTMADAAMMVMMARIASKIRQCAALLRLPLSMVVVADDLQLHVMGPMTRAHNAMAKLYQTTLDAFQEQKLPVKIAKTALLDSGRGAQDRLTKALRRAR